MNFTFPFDSWLLLTARYEIQFKSDYFHINDVFFRSMATETTKLMLYNNNDKKKPSHSSFNADTNDKIDVLFRSTTTQTPTMMFPVVQLRQEEQQWCYISFNRYLFEKHVRNHLIWATIAADFFKHSKHHRWYLCSLPFRSIFTQLIRTRVTLRNAKFTQIAAFSLSSTLRTREYICVYI